MASNPPFVPRSGMAPGTGNRRRSKWQDIAVWWREIDRVALVLVLGNVIVIVSWVAQTFLQLVLLPIIIVGQNIQAKSSDDRAIATYEDAGAILEESREIQAHLGDQDKALNLLVEKVRVLEEQIAKQLKK